MKNLVFLPGALGIAAHWNPVAELLKDEYKIHLVDFPGHGKIGRSAESLDALAKFLSDFLISNDVVEPIIIGYSMGGYVALYAAKNKWISPERIITIATKTSWNREIALSEIGKLNAENLAPIIPKLQAEHGENADGIIELTHKILLSIGENPLLSSDMESIHCPLTMMVGEKDKMVSVDETDQFAIAAPNGNLHVLPAQGHMLERMDPLILTDTIRQLLK